MVFGYNRVRRLSKAPSATPFPWPQMFVLALCRIAEPIAFTSIFPYIYYMIEDFGIAKDEGEIAIYAGMVTSAFTFAEFSAAVLWGRLSDVFGRKPVLLIGLAGTGISMFIFGFARNFQTIIIARALGGLLNGNVGVLQTTVAEVVTAKEHQALAYSIMPFIWTLGSIMGSALGGLLADPVKNYPNTFARGTIWEAYPYLLPNIVCAGVVIAGLIAGLLFLEETNQAAKGRDDYGLVVGRAIIRGVGRLFGRKPEESETDTSEREPLLQNGNSQSYSTSDRPTDAVTGPSEDTVKNIKAPSFKAAFNNQVILQIIAYGLLAYHTMAFEQLFPVLLSMPKATQPAKDPIHFTGGFGLPSSTIGLIYSVQGLYNMFCQISMFPWVAKRVSSLTMFRWLSITWPIWYIIVPYVVLLPEAGQWPFLAVIIVVKITYNAFAYPANALLLANHAPSLLVLGTINGVAASIASLFRALGPSIEGLAQSVGLTHGIMGLGWWTTAVVVVLGGISTIWMTDPDDTPNDEGDSAIDNESLADAAEIVFRRGSRLPPTGPEGQTLIENEEMAISFAAGTHHGRKMSTASRFGPGSSRRFSLVDDHARRLSASAASMTSGRG